MVKALVSFCLLALCAISYGKGNGQADNLFRLLKSRRSKDAPVPDTWALQLDEAEEYSPVYIGPQDGLAELDKIVTLPGQPEGVDFDQYSGYVTVNPSPTEGKALFYYFAESPQNSSTNPLVLWLSGGPGCSSLIGAMTEQGPFKINTDSRTLYRNHYGWNNVANILFLESPAGVGFSYSNSSSVYNTTGDKSTASDAYTFLVNWLERFPQYKARDFYITGESYAGHYAPQLAYTILDNNKKTNHPMINIKGIAWVIHHNGYGEPHGSTIRIGSQSMEYIGNAWIDDLTNQKGFFDYWWTHALNSDETHEGVFKYCNFVNDSSTGECDRFFNKAFDELGSIDLFNIYAPICLDPQTTNGSTGSDNTLDPCWFTHMVSYLNAAEVQKAFHAKPMRWDYCRGFYWTDSPVTILPIIKYLIANGQRLWIYSGDVDGDVPITSSRYSINAMELPIQTAWRPWYLNKEVGGYVEEYEGLVFTTIRGASHTVPASQPERALAMFSSFLQGTLPPAE